MSTWKPASCNVFAAGRIDVAVVDRRLAGDVAESVPHPAVYEHDRGRGSIGAGGDEPALEPDAVARLERHVLVVEVDLGGHPVDRCTPAKSIRRVSLSGWRFIVRAVVSGIEPDVRMLVDLSVDQASVDATWASHHVMRIDRARRHGAGIAGVASLVLAHYRRHPTFNVDTTADHIEDKWCMAQATARS